MHNDCTYKPNIVLYRTEQVGSDFVSVIHLTILDMSSIIVILLIQNSNHNGFNELPRVLNTERWFPRSGWNTVIRKTNFLKWNRDSKVNKLAGYILAGRSSIPGRTASILGLRPTHLLSNPYRGSLFHET